MNSMYALTARTTQLTRLRPPPPPQFCPSLPRLFQMTMDQRLRVRRDNEQRMRDDEQNRSQFQNRELSLALNAALV